MKNVKFDLLNNQNEREIIMSEERLDVLDKVKELVFMKGTEYMTTQQVADYYNVAEGTIRTVIRRNKEELIKNGLKILKGDELKEFKGKLQDEVTLKDSIDMNVYFFDTAVSQPVMYTILGGSVLLCIGGYVLLHTLKKKNK